MSAAGLTVKTRVKLNNKGKSVKRKINATGFKSIGQAAGVHRKIARNIVKDDATPGPTGSPVHSPTDLLRKAIIYELNRGRAYYVVGTAASVIDDLGELHEHGGARGRDSYGPRPFISPSLDKIKPRLNRFWAGQLK
jgi:alkanesulfonate monooxygenase SsuD/methylene tetrahydromethanopterin reductase-like flavin-dependent oxidoreductase (luciferase family)